MAERSAPKKRLIFLALFLYVLFSFLIIQFFKVQIIEEDKWLKHANAQHQAIVAEPFVRGGFYSNTSVQAGHPETKVPLVIDVTKYHLHIDPFSLPKENSPEIQNYLLSVLDLSEEEVSNLEYSFQLENKRDRRIALWLDKQQKETIETWWFPYAKKHKIAKNALFFTKDYKRSYPYGNLLGQVLHTIRDIKDETTHQGLPTGGLELYFNSYLKGKEGKRKFVRSPLRPLDSGTLIEKPENGANIYLTINHHLQAMAEQEIKKGVQVANAKGGWAVIMDPYTGEILALAQYPFFAPENYRDYFNDKELMDHTRAKAINDAYEPGSIMKPLTLALLLHANQTLIERGEAPLFTPEEKVSTGVGRFKGRSRDLRDSRRHSYLNMYLAMQKSSNIYFAKLIDRLIDRLGNQWYYDQLGDLFGLGKPTHISYPSESCGMLPEPGKTYFNGKLQWSLPTPYSLAMGHNLLVTSLQMLRAYAAFANGGYLVEPRLVKKIVKEDEFGNEEVIKDFDQKRDFPRVLDPSIIEEVIKAMKYVVKQGGSSAKAEVYGYTGAGKSGTANRIVDGRYSKKEYFSSFIGFGPLSKPRYLILVSIDNPHSSYIPGRGFIYWGGQCAAPIYKEIARKTLQYMGIAPDNPYGYPVGDPRRRPEKADWEKETHDLLKLYEEWNQG